MIAIWERKRVPKENKNEKKPIRRAPSAKLRAHKTTTTTKMATIFIKNNRKCYKQMEKTTPQAMASSCVKNQKRK